MGKIKNSVITLLLGLVLIAAIRLSLHSQQTSDRALFKAFDEAAISGKLYSVHTESKGAAIFVTGMSHALIFYPRTNTLLNQGHYFNSFAEPGDSVIKAQHSDTLFLIKQGCIYKYLFRKNTTQ